MKTKQNHLPTDSTSPLNKSVAEALRGKICEIIKGQNIPSWVSDFINNEFLPERLTIVLKMVEYEGLKSVFSKIDKQLPSYEINVYKEIETKISSKRVINKRNVLSAIKAVHIETKEKLEPYKTIWGNETLSATSLLYDEIEVLQPFPRLKRPHLIRLLRELLPEGEIEKNYDRRAGRQVVLEAIIGSAVWGNPDPPKATNRPTSIFLSTKEMRQEHDRLEDCQKEIQKKTRELIRLLNIREQILERGIITSKGNIDPLYLFKEAGRDNRRFDQWIVPAIDKARYSSSLECPSFIKFLNGLCKEMELGGSEYNRSFVDLNYVLNFNVTSTRDFVRVFCLSIEECKQCHQLPESFELTADTIAEIGNAILGDEVSGLTESQINKTKKEVKEYIKRRH